VDLAEQHQLAGYHKQLDVVVLDEAVHAVNRRIQARE